MRAIRGSVGRGGLNRGTDVQTVQNLINNQLRHITPLAPLKVDGKAGNKTYNAIDTFQRRIVGLSRPDGRVDANGRTIRKLAQSSSSSTSTSPLAPPATPTPSKKITISGVSMPDKAKKVLEEILSASGHSSARVTSAKRTAADQARIMYDNIKRKGVSYNYRLYGKTGDKVVTVYKNNKSKKKSEIISLMAAKITEVGPAKVSKHCSTTHYVFDVAPSSIKNDSKFLKAIKEHKAVSKHIAPPKDPAFHIEIPKNSPHL